jgi:type I restriction enzyme, S subunit
MIPDGWEIKCGEDIASKITKGQSPKWQGFEYQDSGTLFVTSENVRDGRIDVSKPKYLPLAFNNKLKGSQLKKNDILINIVGASIGRSCQFNLDTEYANINQAVCLFRLKNDINHSYIVQFLQLPSTISTLIGTQTESARPNLSLANIREFKFLLPPLLEQCRIAEVLGVWDESIDLLERLIGRVRSRKQGLMQQLLTGKKRFKEFGLPVISEDSIPNTWRKVTLRETAAKEKYSFTGGPFGSNLKAEHYIDEGVRIIQLQNIGDGHFNDRYKIFTTEEKADELISCNIYPGDIILSKMGDPVARACFIPNSAPRFLMASDGIRLKVNKSEFDPFFLLQQINSPIFRKIAIAHSTGSTRQRIGLDILRDLPILTPPLPEQEKIAAVLSAADEEISTLEKQLAAYKQQKLGLMQQLLTGKIRVGII